MHHGLGFTGEMGDSGSSPVNWLSSDLNAMPVGETAPWSLNPYRQHSSLTTLVDGSKESRFSKVDQSFSIDDQKISRFALFKPNNALSSSAIGNAGTYARLQNKETNPALTHGMLTIDSIEQDYIINWTSRKRNLSSEIGLYLPDENGRVRGISPESKKYPAAVLKSESRQVIFRTGEKVGAWQQISLGDAERVAFYIIPSKKGNPTPVEGNNPRSTRRIRFSIDEANPDGSRQMISRLLGDGIIELGWQNQERGDKKEWNDVVMTVAPLGMQVPGSAGARVPMKLQLKPRRTKDAVTEMGVYLVDNKEGHVDGIKPGQRGYRKAALAARRSTPIFNGDSLPLEKTIMMPGGKYYGWYLKTEKERGTKTSRGRNKVNTLFSYASANKDKLNHFHATKNSATWEWESSLGGGDRDFRDLGVVFEFKDPISSKPRRPAIVDDKPVDDTAPVADGETATVAEGGTSSNLALLSGDTDGPQDPSGAALQVAEVNGITLATLTPQTSGTYAGFYAITGINGTLHVKADGTAFYVHNGTDTTSDSFTYRAIDAAGNLSNTATIGLIITPIDDTAPVADGETATVTEGAASGNLSLLSGDTDSPDDPSGAGLKVASVNDVLLSGLTPQASGTYAGFYAIAGSNGTLYVKTDGTAYYVHNGSKSGSDGFIYRAVDAGGNLSNSAAIALTITPVNAPIVEASLINDTGRSKTDQLTQDPTLSGQIRFAIALWGRLNDKSAVDLSAALKPDGSFILGEKEYRELSDSQMPDGNYTLVLESRNSSGSVSAAQNISFRLDRTPPPLQFDLAPESDTGVQKDRITAERQVTLLSESEAGGLLWLEGTDLTLEADGQGRAAFTNVAMPSAGAAPFAMVVADGAGNQARVVNRLMREGINSPPVITSIPGLVISDDEQNPYTYQIVAIDLDNDALNYLLIKSPSDARINETGLITFMPAAMDRGPFEFELEVNDGRSGSVRQSFTLVRQDGSISGDEVPEFLSEPDRTFSLVGSGSLNTREIRATIRDFSDMHPNFEDSGPFSFGNTTGMVEDQLGSDGKPVLKNGYELITQDEFRQWYSDIPGINVASPISFLLTESAPGSGIYEYVGEETGLGNYFPIDGELIGNEGRVHNYHFTTEIHTSLVYRGGEVFSFQGDDDVWVFIDKKLALDLGGVHPPVGGEINLDVLGLIPGNSYSLDIFQAERQTSGSTFRFQTSLDLTSSRQYFYQVQTLSPSNDVVTYELLQGPQGMGIDASTGLISWSPSLSQIGVHAVQIKATDSKGLSSVQAFDLNILSSNPGSIQGTVYEDKNRNGVQNVADGEVGLEGWKVFFDENGNNDLDDNEVFATTNGNGLFLFTGLPSDSYKLSIIPQEGWDPLASRAVLMNSGQDVEVNLAVNRTAPDQEAPRVSLRPSQTVFAQGDSLALQVSATDNQAVTSLELLVDGVSVTLAPGLPDGLNTATILLDRLGVFDVVATATDKAGNIGKQTLRVWVPDPTDATPPEVNVDLGGLSSSQPILSAKEIRGTIAGDPESWRVQIAPVNLVDLSNPGADDPDFVTIGQGRGPISDGLLATLDPTLYRNDSYLLRVVAQDFSGNLNLESTVVTLFSEIKPGEFSLDFSDLSIPLTGLPIEVRRVYNSLNAQSLGDFGYGWSLSLQDVQIQESAPDSRDLGASADLFGTTPFMVGTRVSLTTPDGRRVGFTFNPVPYAASFFAGTLYKPVFTPDPGVFDTLEVDGEGFNIASDGSARYLGFGLGLSFNPDEYRLRTKEGTIYRYGQTAGLIDITDRNGNTLTYSDNGILSSTGRGVTFVRDGLGRITQIIDPEGKAITYSYDTNGDLKSVVDREQATTTFSYDVNRLHYLSQVTDSLGRKISRTEYDEQGRIQRIIDADGKALELSYDTDARVQVVRDPLGHTITLISDERGNVIEQVDANGGITKRTYDTNNNVLTNTDPEGNTTTYSYDTRGNKLSETNPEGEKRTYEYSPTNKLLKETDALGFSTTYTYDERDNLLSRTDANGKTTTYAYDARGQMTSITDANGKLSSFNYDQFGNLTTLTDPTGAVTSFTYDANGQVNSMTDPLGAITNYVYDSQGRLIEQADPEGSSCGCARGITKTEYNKAGEMVAEIDALGRRTEYRYNNRGLLIETILPDDTPATNSDNPRLKIEYDAADRMISSSDELGRITFYGYDKLGQLIETIYPDATPHTLDDNPRTRKEYDKAGRVIAEVDELGHRSTFAYDKAGRLIEQTNALGEKTTHSYDDNGRKVSMTDALGRVTTYGYDGMDRLVSTTYANSSTATTTYDALGRVIQETDLAGLNTRYEYDPLGQLTAVVDALNQRTEYTYDKVGNLITQKDANGHTTSFTYDSLRRRVDMVLPEGQLKKTIHDLIGNLIRSTDANGVTTTYTYDDRNRLIEKAFSDGTPTETFTYTATGQLKTVTDNRGTTEYAYDERDRLLSRTEPDGRTITYTYDNAGNIHTLTVPSGTTTYTYDALNRLDTVTDPDGGFTDYNYDAVGNLKTTTFANGVVETRDYDPLNRLLYLENRGVVGVLSSYRYSLDAMGNRLKVEEQDGRTVSYSYDDLYRLTKEQIVDPSSGNRTVSFEYDPVGNRLKRIDSLAGTTTYSYDTNDRLLAEVLAGQTITYSYDNNGSLTAKAINGQTEAEYRWNAKGELSGATVRDSGSTNVVSFEYDHEGMRVAATVNGQETRFLLDTTQQRYAQVIEEYLANGTLTRSYSYGRDLLSQDDTSARSYYQVDGLGSTRQLTDASGNVTLSYDYQAFGELLQKVGSGDNRYLFAGEQLDDSVNLTYLRARYYTANSGLFISRDPIEGEPTSPQTLNDYTYALNSPLVRVDPSGLFSVVEYSLDLGLKESDGFILGSIAGFAVSLFAAVGNSSSYILGEISLAVFANRSINDATNQLKIYDALSKLPKFGKGFKYGLQNGLITAEGYLSFLGLR